MSSLHVLCLSFHFWHPFPSIHGSHNLSIPWCLSCPQPFSWDSYKKNDWESFMSGPYIPCIPWNFGLVSCVLEYIIFVVHHCGSTFLNICKSESLRLTLATRNKKFLLLLFQLYCSELCLSDFCVVFVNGVMFFMQNLLRIWITSEFMNMWWRIGGPISQ